MQTKSFIMAMLGLLPAAITGVMAQATLSNLCLKDWLMDGSYMYVACKNIGGALQWSKLDVDAFLINRGQKSLAFADGGGMSYDCSDFKKVDGWKIGANCRQADGKMAYIEHDVEPYISVVFGRPCVRGVGPPGHNPWCSTPAAVPSRNPSKDS